MKRRQRSQPHSFENQIAAEISRCKQRLAMTPAGRERDAVIAKINQLESTISLNRWLSSDSTVPKS